MRLFGSLLSAALAVLALALSSCAGPKVTLWDGPVQEDWENGKPKIRGIYRNSQKHDEWKFYNSDGELARVEKYEEGNPIGEWKRYPEKELVPIQLTESKQMMWVQFFTGDPAPGAASLNYGYHVKEWLRVSQGLSTGGLGSGGGFGVGTEAHLRLPRSRFSPILGVGPSYYKVGSKPANSRFTEVTQNTLYLNMDLGIEYLEERTQGAMLRGIGISTTVVPTFLWGAYVRLGIVF